MFFCCCCCCSSSTNRVDNSNYWRNRLLSFDLLQNVVNIFMSHKLWFISILKVYNNQNKETNLKRTNPNKNKTLTNENKLFFLFFVQSNFVSTLAILFHCIFNKKKLKEEDKLMKSTSFYSVFAWENHFNINKNGKINFYVLFTGESMTYNGKKVHKIIQAIALSVR